MKRLIFSIKDTDLQSFTCSLNCGGGCIRHIIVKHLQLLEFDALFEVAQVRQKDIDFRSQFEIARPTQSYIDLIACLPVILVGSAEKLSQVLSILADEAKLSLKNNKIYVSPWRSLSYMRCEWLYPLERSDKHTRVTNQVTSQLILSKYCFGHCFSLPPDLPIHTLFMILLLNFNQFSKWHDERHQSLK
ncbi:hypothetical protein KP509_01G086100 [Ceratopteris richardii]|uniref:Uncharacterized protein n=1 Tax=Ceratopteris richardii TaxID=49495 RepID=A0A8T2VEW9_CERRI|nr:hypothetical protein KP509_01G086100 [Ceratopteris richardii]